AALKSRDMYDNNYFSHDSPTYGSPFDMMTKFGIKYSGAAENIAKNSSVAAAHNAFMNSQGHRDNILNPIYTHIGVGIYKGYYTQMFIRK
ncbi:MAG TPA: CAP domain-containing protein, partial [Clostridia bacterium]|nr:CAP domain-containing protein [Clostridia bacterium]